MLVANIFWSKEILTCEHCVYAVVGSMKLKSPDYINHKRKVVRQCEFVSDGLGSHFVEIVSYSRDTQIACRLHRDHDTQYWSDRHL